MAKMTNEPIQLEFALPAAPDTTPIHAAVEARLESITIHALPAARARRRFLETVWASDEANAVEIFITERISFLCSPPGVDRVSGAAANESALLSEAVALHDLRCALERYDAGGPLVTGADFEVEVPPLAASAVTSTQAGPPAFCTLEDRTAHVEEVRAYLRDVEHEVQEAMQNRRADMAAALRAERIGVEAHLKSVTDGVRRRARASDRSRANENRGRRIA
jgi:hypothetical protein